MHLPLTRFLAPPRVIRIGTLSLLALGSALMSTEAGEPGFWTRPDSDSMAENEQTSYYSWDIFDLGSDPVFSPDVTSFGPDGATLTASGNYIVTTSNNLYGFPSFSLNLPGFGTVEEGYTTIFLQPSIVVGSAGTATAFQLHAGGKTYNPLASGNGGVYFQIANSYTNYSLTFSTSVDHTSLGGVSVDTFWSVDAPDLSSLASSGNLPIIPGGAYSSLGYGYSPAVSAAPNSLGSLTFNGAINESGVSVYTTVLNVGGVIQGNRAVRTNPDGQILELTTMGTNTAGFAAVTVADINNAGLAVGQASKIVDGSDKGLRGVIWDTATGQVTELANLGTNPSGATTITARAINESGAVAGRAFLFNSAGVQQENRAVRWEAGGTVATDLGTGDAYGINNAGTVVGITGRGASAQAAKWNAGSATPIVLSTNGGLALAISETGVITGYTGAASSSTAARWEANSTTATSLSKPIEFNGGGGRSSGLAVNDAGHVVGHATRYSSTGGSIGDGAVLWKAGETVGVALDSLGVNSSGNVGQSFALDINNAGFIVGSATAFDETGLSLGFRAVVWNLDGEVVDLNSYLGANSGWVLLHASDITDNGWITGVGSFSSIDGTYDRSFSMHLTEFGAVPEPGSIALVGLGLAAVSWMVRKRKA